jgi:hypothetical protein
MPTLLQMRIPLSVSSSEFEDITRSALKIRWKSSNLQRFGRNGQSQYGVDIAGLDDLRRNVGVQCRSEEKITIAKIKAAAVKAEEYQPSLQAFYLATGTTRDGRLHQAVMLYSEKRQRAGKFPIGILFWEDLYEELVTDIDEFGKHYPQFVPAQTLLNTGVRDTKSILEVKAANQQYRAAKEVYTLRHDLVSNLTDRPDIDWDDVEEFIAIDFMSHEKRIEEILERYGLDISEELKSQLTAAHSICVEGKAQVDWSEGGPQVSQSGCELAHKLYDVLDEAAKTARKWLHEKLGA